MKRKKQTVKPSALLVSLLLLLTVTVGGTLAFLLDSSGPITNVFTPSQVTTKVDESFNGSVKSNVRIRNTGDTAAWIRAAVVITWQDADGNVYGKAPVANEDYTISYDLVSGWEKGDDGFYYWTKPVAATSEGEASYTGILISQCKPFEDKVPEGYYLTVEILGSGIQSKPADAFETAWTSSGLKVDTADEDPMNWKLVKEGGQ